jgi:hypothetical protein
LPIAERDEAFGNHGLQPQSMIGREFIMSFLGRIVRELKRIVLGVTIVKEEEYVVGRP